MWNKVKKIFLQNILNTTRWLDFFPIASAITDLGRKLLTFIKEEFIRTAAIQLLAGDTDSIFVNYFLSFLRVLLKDVKEEWQSLYKQINSMIGKEYEQKMNLLDRKCFTLIYKKLA